ncbi:MAG: replicative DNA helicase [Gammaproteobacteria bacterium]|nr:MAG: replicative DNA helicase [Gammaproteobacteria bacterium]
MTSSKPQTVEYLKTPPHSVEAEQSVLGGILVDPDAWDRVSDLLVERDFYRHDHRLIFRAMTALASQSEPLDVITIHDFLEREGLAKDAGGLPYLAELAKNTPSAANVRAYAKIVREKAVLRELVSAANAIVEKSLSQEGHAVADVLDYAESQIFRIAEEREKNDAGPRGVQELLQSVLDRIEEYQTAEGGVTGIRTGFTDLDKMTSGLQPQDLVIIAGRPSMGKTTFAMNIADHVAIKEKKPVLVFSMEMPAEALIMRSISALSRVDQSNLRKGRLTEADWTNINSAIGLLESQSKLYIDDSPGLTPTEVRSRARRLAREHGGLSLIVIDYLQLMRVPGMAENRTLEVSEISRSLKALAKELNVPVIALSQLNRGLETRGDKRPVMADLRESGAIEQDADLIMFVYRDEVYHKDTADKGIAEIIIGKQRNGPIGTIKLVFNGKWTRFDNLAEPERYDEV